MKRQLWIWAFVAWAGTTGFAQEQPPPKPEEKEQQQQQTPPPAESVPPEQKQQGETPPAASAPEPEQETKATVTSEGGQPAEAAPSISTETSKGLDPATISPNYRSPMPPPHPLAKVGEHWSPYAAPPVPEGAEVYVIQGGDTLWDLAAKHMGDSYLWPHVWQQNAYITDPHWIYPGDPLLFKPVTVLTPEVVAQAVETAREAEMPGEEVTPAVKTEAGEELAKKEEGPKFILDVGPAGPRPAATFDEMYCSYFIEEEKPVFDLHVVSLQNEDAEIGATGDFVYLNQGYENGLEGGQEFGVLHLGSAVKHPTTHRRLGTAVYQVGRVRIVAAQAKTATAKVLYSCREIRPGDGIVPWTEIPVPLYVDKPLDAAAYASSGKLKGNIVFAKDNIVLVGERHIVTVDLGEKAGLAPGDALTIYRENPAGKQFQPYLVGELIVLTTRASTSTCKIMRSLTESDIGSTVEIK